MPFYDYKCTKCSSVQEEMHGMHSKKQIKCNSCGEICNKIVSAGIVGNSSNREIWEYNDIRDYNPKFIKSRSGKRIKYDASKHGYGKGIG